MNIFKKLVTFIKESQDELKNVKWPSKKQARQYTKSVVLVSLIVAAFLGTLDLIFNQIVTSLL